MSADIELKDRCIAELYEAIGEHKAEIERLRAQLTEAAAFLDGVAHNLLLSHESRGKRAADCRAMAAKLRGET